MLAFLMHTETHIRTIKETSAAQASASTSPRALVGLGQEEDSSCSKRVTKRVKEEEKARLTYLMLAQAHLSKKVSGGDLSASPKLKEIQILINQ